MNKFIFLVIFSGFIVPFSVFAMPSRWGIAINPETRECAAYWGGDDYPDSGDVLPDGWKGYYTNAVENDDEVIKTEWGACIFLNGRESECCETMGLIFIEDINTKSPAGIDRIAARMEARGNPFFLDKKDALDNRIQNKVLWVIISALALMIISLGVFLLMGRNKNPRS